MAADKEFLNHVMDLLAPLGGIMDTIDTKGKVLKVFEDAYPTDLSIMDAAKGAGVMHGTASTYIKVLVAEGRLEETRRMGNAVLFRLKKLGNVW